MKIAGARSPTISGQNTRIKHPYISTGGCSTSIVVPAALCFLADIPPISLHHWRCHSWLPFIFLPLIAICCHWLLLLRCVGYLTKRVPWTGTLTCLFLVVWSSYLFTLSLIIGLSHNLIPIFLFFGHLLSWASSVLVFLLGLKMDWIFFFKLSRFCSKSTS